jgi:hypothetical protein
VGARYLSPRRPQGRGDARPRGWGPPAAQVRDEFVNCTLISIAHRLHTVIDADAVLVMDRGRAAEYGPPAELLANTDGVFAGAPPADIGLSVSRVGSVAEPQPAAWGDLCSWLGLPRAWPPLSSAAAWPRRARRACRARARGGAVGGRPRSGECRAAWCAGKCCKELVASTSFYICVPTCGWRLAARAQGRMT